MRHLGANRTKREAHAPWGSLAPPSRPVVVLVAIPATAAEDACVVEVKVAWRALPSPMQRQLNRDRPLLFVGCRRRPSSADLLLGTYALPSCRHPRSDIKQKRMQRRGSRIRNAAPLLRRRPAMLVWRRSRGLALLRGPARKALLLPPPKRLVPSRLPLPALVKRLHWHVLLRCLRWVRCLSRCPERLCAAMRPMTLHKRMPARLRQLSEHQHLRSELRRP